MYNPKEQQTLFDSFNTTACVGSRPESIGRQIRGLGFNTTACVGSSPSHADTRSVRRTFQYNCLCRFEIVTSCTIWSITWVSIQLLVSVRVISVLLSPLIVYGFNTTACVGSSISMPSRMWSLTSFNTTACVGSSVLTVSQSDVFSCFNTTACVGSSSRKAYMKLPNKPVSIQLLVSVRDASTDTTDAPTMFQYNCLCRFERIDSWRNSQTTTVSIQLLVSVRAALWRYRQASLFVSIQLLVSVRDIESRSGVYPICVSIQLLVSVRVEKL